MKLMTRAVSSYICDVMTLLLIVAGRPIETLSVSHIHSVFNVTGND
jgi:hypothetical protein